MLSKIIEHTADQRVAAEFCLERVASGAAKTRPSSNVANTAAQVEAFNQRIAQLERALLDTEAAAYSRGRREAEAEAQQRYGAAMQSTADRLAQSVKQLADVRPRVCKEAEADLLRLAMAIAQRILHRQLTIDTTALEALVRVSLDRLGRQDQIRIRVCAPLADAVRAILGKICSKAIDVTPDANLEAGGLIFETARGQLDVSLHSQLDEIERGLIDRLENRPERA
jgi:flagellar assembly protein FliH